MNIEATSTASRASENRHTKPYDVFAAARWLNDLWNSTAKAVSPETIEWQCNTWGSGRGHGDWIDTATFNVVVAVFHLATSRNWEGRDELVVSVPLGLFREISRLIDLLGPEPEEWSWLAEENEDRQIDEASEALGIPAAMILANDDLLEALRLV